ncbi:hypoxanthine phosphoribosyltransferase [Candidatus Hoaglandella endobia]|uniref:Hypoxanthine phosphoribosyltransferase n=1 Tax=Candidatus Hoaglandella endobia TaxID=1778263 RepID=A0A143WUA6_9ENTR|nr:hypoxanthine phosphoribosyltransferase [Candidatus Hoaglandella endobia]CUX97278.1 Hypoxanthine phosphoribosyltransferase [Candidatus Hoaglandella endobia]
MKYTVEVLISKQDIAQRIAELGLSISDHYRYSSNVVLIALLRGSFIFIADLCRALSVSHEIDFITTSSYGMGINSCYDVTIIKDIDDDISGKDVLIVEDIIDSGKTLSRVCEILALRHPQSISICTLLDKPNRREVKVVVEWVGFTIPDEFVVGYGIDYSQRYRHLPYVGRLVAVA